MHGRPEPKLKGHTEAWESLTNTQGVDKRVGVLNPN